MSYCSFCPQKYDECRGFKDKEIATINLTIADAEKDLMVAIRDLYSNNYDLITRRVHERCITNYIFHYFLVNNGEKYKNYHIDSEYDKNGDSTKRYRENKSGVPDLIIHRRLCNRENLLYVEFKSKTSLDATDKAKLCAFTNIDSSNVRSDIKYMFNLGCGVEMETDKVSFHWYRNGQEECERKYNYIISTNCFELVCS